LLAVLGLLSSGLVWAEDWTTSWESVREAASGIRTVQARFTQEKDLAILAKPLISEGSFAFAAPDRLRWEYASPLPSLLLCRGEEVERYVQREGEWVKNAATTDEAMRFVVEELRLWLRGAFRESETFTPRLLGDANAAICLMPKDEQLTRFFEHITLRLAARPGVIERVVVTEGPRSRTTIRFEDVRLNEKIPTRMFRQP
jgi:outer membrane lipoprotein-sorting protein